MEDTNSIRLNVNFNFQQLLDAIKQLSSKEKIKVNEALWEDSMDIPVTHQKLVLDRVEKAKKDPSRLLDWEEASKKLR